MVETLARECGFDLCGVTRALPVQPDADQFLDWIARGNAGQMYWLTDHRAEIRTDPRRLLPAARSIICLGRSYNNPGNGPISRYARSEDYHDVLRCDMERLVAHLAGAFGSFESRICVDTAPLLERSYAHLSGIGWIGRNTCLINQQLGSYVFLGEILTSLELEPGTPAPDRCGTCTRCIDACPTDAIVPGGLRTELDSNRCISYLTIELKGDIPEPIRSKVGTLAFGCDICQDVCPWNWQSPVTSGPHASPDLEALASMTPDEFRNAFRRTPVWRTRYQGMLRNVAVAMANSGESRYRESLESLARSGDPVVASHAQWGLKQFDKESGV